MLSRATTGDMAAQFGLNLWQAWTHTWMTITHWTAILTIVKINYSAGRMFNN